MVVFTSAVRMTLERKSSGPDVTQMGILILLVTDSRIVDRMFLRRSDEGPSGSVLCRFPNNSIHNRSLSPPKEDLTFYTLDDLAPDAA